MDVFIKVARSNVILNDVKSLVIPNLPATQIKFINKKKKVYFMKRSKRFVRIKPRWVLIRV